MTVAKLNAAKEIVQKKNGEKCMVSVTLNHKKKQQKEKTVRRTVRNSRRAPGISLRPIKDVKGEWLRKTDIKLFVKHEG